METKRHQTVMGRRIGPYEVSGFLGVGGMGMVYRAADTRLRRNVALKFLPKGVMLDSDAMERFRREARVASQLVHPNICTIYDMAEHDGAPYLVMELLEGRNLRDRLAGRSMDLAEALDISIQVAEALAAASEQGVVHRDLKPANIYITKSGVVKLLDFGLARIAGPERRGDSVTITVPGARLGTVAYTSPEQALGEAVDGRADVFSLGVAMYEMATHSLPFRGEGPVAMYDAILHKAHVPADKANPLLPPQMVAILDKALAKDKALRYQSAEELRDELKALRRLTESGSRMNTKTMLTPAVAMPAKVPNKKRAWPIAAAVAAVALCGLGAYAYLGPWQAGPSLRTASFAPLTGETGEEFYPSFAPDGKSFVYAARVLGNWDIYARRVRGVNPINITPNSLDDDTEPMLSPDGERVAFRSEREGGGIFVMGATGESARKLVGEGHNPAWSPDGSEIVYGTAAVLRPLMRGKEPSELWAVKVADGSKRAIAKKDGCDPKWSPHGRRIAFMGLRNGQRHVYTVSAAGEDLEETQVTSGESTNWSPAWSPDGRYLYFSSDRGGSMNLWRVRIDEKAGATRGEPEALTTPSPYSGQLSFSGDGSRLAYVQHSVAVHLYSLDFDAAAGKASPPVVLTRGQRKDRTPDVTADGKHLVFRGEEGKQEDLYTLDLESGAVKRLMDDKALDRAPRWAPDGSRIAFHTTRDGRQEIWTVRPDGSELTKLTRTSGPAPVFPLWSPRGDRLAYSRTDATAFVIDPERPGQVVTELPAFEGKGEWFAASSWSRDGGKLAGFISLPAASAGIAIYDFGAGKFTRYAAAAGYQPQFLPDGRVVYTVNSEIMLLDPKSGKSSRIADVKPFALGPKLAVSPDGRKIYASLAPTESDIWMVEFDAKK